MKNKKLKYLSKWYIIIMIIISPFIMFIFYPKYFFYSLENAPKLNFEQAIDSISVKKIDFGRGGLKLNRIRYNAFGISAYSTIHNENESFELYKLRPPFILSKEANNDTLKIVKDDKTYYLLINEEKRW